MYTVVSRCSVWPRWKMDRWVTSVTMNLTVSLITATFKCDQLRHGAVIIYLILGNGIVFALLSNRISLCCGKCMKTLSVNGIQMICFGGLH